MKETWKQIPGHKGYQVSNMGKIKGLTGKILKPFNMGNGYLGVSLGIKRRAYIHRLVLEAFIGFSPENFQCAHLDGNRKNNNLENLKWVSIKENMSHKKIHGTENIGIKNGGCKITEKEAQEIIDINKQKKLTTQEMKDLSLKYKIHYKSIQKIVYKIKWKHLS